jgi:hypothetical protein
MGQRRRVRLSDAGRQFALGSRPPHNVGLLVWSRFTRRARELVDKRDPSGAQRRRGWGMPSQSEAPIGSRCDSQLAERFRRSRACQTAVPTNWKAWRLSALSTQSRIIDSFAWTKYPRAALPHISVLQPPAPLEGTSWRIERAPEAAKGGDGAGDPRGGMTSGSADEARREREGARDLCAGRAGRRGPGGERLVHPLHLQPVPDGATGENARRGGRSESYKRRSSGSMMN